MKTITLVRNGPAATAFEIQEQAKPTLTATQVGIEVEAFGLNYADVMARIGMYDDAPPLPAVLGYEVVGRITAIGSAVKGRVVGERVVAMTRFGGYADYAVTEAMTCAPIPEEMSAGVAAALCTQYITAYFAACEQTNLFAGDKVVVHAAAGGVGIALVQIAKSKGCTVFGTCGSDEKVAFLRSIGVDFPINYNTQDWVAEVQKQTKKVDVVFDSIGGKTAAQGWSLLNAGGRLVMFGVASMTGNGTKNTLNAVRMAIGFGLYSPIQMLTSSRSMMGVNMLRVADKQPRAIQRCLEGVVALYEAGVCVPHIGGEFAATDIVAAHELLGGRGSIGKVVCKW